ncbi:MAG: thiamine-phosphate kinase [Phycisphaerales bacterium]
MREAELLQHIYRRSAELTSDEIVVGPGDDCAVLRGGLLVTVDQLVEGRHYEPGTPLRAIARKAVGRAVSDIAAMGGTPSCGFASAALRTGFDREDELFDLMSKAAIDLGCPLAGGDISRVGGPTVLSLTILGRAHPSRGPVLRSGARAGDQVHVTGRLGGAVSSGRHLEPTPRVAEARWLCDALGDQLTGMIDLSDGLGRDAGRIGRASGVRLELDAKRLPTHPHDGDLLGWLAQGEDYELLFTARGEVDPSSMPTGLASVTRIGRAIDGSPGAVCAIGGETVNIDELGWDHAG